MHGKVLAIEGDRFDGRRHDDRGGIIYIGNEGLGLVWWTASEQ